MINETIVTDISHLDFEIEDDKIHYQHPTNRLLAWCGAPYPHPQEPQYIVGVEEITCEGCVQKYREVGPLRYWDLRGRGGEEYIRAHAEYRKRKNA